MEKAEVVTVSSKGQVVVPLRVRRKLHLGVGSKLLVYPHGDSLVMKKLEVGDLEKELEAVFERVDAEKARYGELSQTEVNALVQRYRHS